MDPPGEIMGTSGALFLFLMLPISTGFVTGNQTSPDYNSSGVEGEVRLANEGNSTCSGRVEIFHQGQWGTVCDDYWDLGAADVVCRQLGCGRARVAPQNAAFGPGTGPIWMDDILCFGSELSLTDCRHNGFGNHDCGHIEDAGVICEGNQTSTDNNSSGLEGEVRLANEGNSSCSGRVEIFHQGQWGTVCDDEWDLGAADVVCRQLGCGRAQAAPQNAAFERGTGPIWMDDIRCFGSELSLTDCRHNGFGNHDCGHSEDAGVICEGNQTSPDYNSSGQEGEVRLANEGNSSCSGRVEIFHQGQWGTVCDDEWDLEAADVVCRQLGCGRARAAPQNAAFGPGTGLIWMDEILCFGSELSLTDCLHDGFGNHDCDHSKDAGVICEGNQTSPDNNSSGLEGEVRLANEGNSSCSGRVEIFHQGQWGTVCDDEWDLGAADVVCRQLGCGRARAAPQNAVFGPGTGPIWMDEIRCFGSELSLTDCRHDGFGNHNCDHSEDAGVICEGNQTSTDHNSSGQEGEVRLANEGNSSCSGRVEIFHQGQWGTVCDDYWDLEAADVVCRQLGCGRARAAPQNAAFGPGTGLIWMDNIRCFGSELSLTDCLHDGFGNHDCSHIEDAGVICEGNQTSTDNNSSGQEGEVRLANEGNSSCSGRVEIFHRGQWGTVCDDDWDLEAADVVCRQLGCGRARAAPQNAAFGRGTGPIWMDEIRCFGSEVSLADCRHNGFGNHNCDHSEDAGVVCEFQYPEVQVYQLSCGHDQIQIALNRATVSHFGFNPMSGHLVDSNCTQSRFTNSMVWYEVEPRGGFCGNTERTNRTHIIYSNRLFLYAHNNSFHIIFHFSCVYPLDMGTSLNAAHIPLVPTNGIIASVEVPSTLMSLYRDPSYSSTYPSGSVSVPASQPLYVAISMEENNLHFVIVVDECYITYTSNPNDPMIYSLIQNRCSSDPLQVSVIESGTSLRARFSARFFVPGRQNRAMYLHCRLSLCSPGPCVPICSGTERQTVSEGLPLGPLTIGPITRGTN